MPGMPGMPGMRINALGWYSMGCYPAMHAWHAKKKMNNGTILSIYLL